MGSNFPRLDLQPQKAAAQRRAKKFISAINAASWAILDAWRFRLESRASADGDSGLVSVVIATYDRAEILVERTIPSLLESSYKELEVIVVCDGGPPKVREAVSTLDDERIRFVQLRKRSKYPKDPRDLWFVAGSRPRNVGARIARGQFLFWISDDDVIMPDGIDALVRHLREHPHIDAVGGAVQIGEANPIINLPSQNSDRIGFETGAMPGWLHRRRLRAFRWSTNSWLKEWNRPADYDLAERMMAKGVRFGAIDEIVAAQVEVGDRGLIGSKAAVLEELERRQAKKKLSQNTHRVRQLVRRIVSPAP